MKLSFVTLLILLVMGFETLWSQDTISQKKEKGLSIGLATGLPLEYLRSNGISDYKACDIPFQYFVKPRLSFGVNAGFVTKSIMNHSSDGDQYSTKTNYLNLNFTPTVRYYIHSTSSKFGLILVSGIGLSYLKTNEYYRHTSSTFNSTDWFVSGNIGLGGICKLNNRLSLFSDVGVASYFNASDATSTYADHYEGDFWCFSVPVTAGINFRLK